ncbi:MAG: serine/threonine protein kinase [Planctomycetes bacterium]|nr:serine/threonine protein kinase [Planctomycetota bacterium]
MCPEIIEIEQYATAALPEQRGAELRHHLEACAECRDRLAEVEENLRVAEPVGAWLRRRAGSAASAGVAGNVGNYRIVRQIGCGGMGVVYEAHQAQPERRVALKVLHGTAAGDERMERLFRREIRALGRLTHPGIAAIHDAGYTAEGRPYFAMELVAGDPLLEYADRHGLSLELRLRLFIRVGDAVSYAHQRGVIHRDLKPSNILVTAEGIPKVLDFGLARVLEAESDDSPPSVLTEPGRVSGTVPYMSPEQVRGESGDLDVRSDLYSLGVILYQLLTGALPYPVDPHRLTQAARVICEQPPASPAALVPALRGDIETIVLKTLEKEPAARYAAVSALTEDIRRVLDHEPILARPPSLRYQLRKLVRRHRLPFAFAAVVLLLVLAFGVVAGTLAVRLGRERSAALAARDRETDARRAADEQRDAAASVTEFLQDLLAAADPSVYPSRPDVTLREVLDGAARRISEGALANRPSVVVTLETTVGNAYRAMGQYEAAQTHLDRALALGREQFGASGHASLVQAMNKSARLLEERGRYPEAESAFREALDMQRRLVNGDHADVAKLLNNLGLLVHRQGRSAEGERLLREALAMRRRLTPSDHASVATNLNNLALVLHAAGDLAGAEEMFRESLEMDRRLRHGDHPNLASTMSNLATVLTDRGRTREAEPLLREAVDMKRRLLGEEHADVAIAINNLAANLKQQQRLEECESLYRQALNMQQRLLGERHPAGATTAANLANVLSDRGDWPSAEALHRTALEIRRESLGEEHPATLASYYHVAGTLLHRGQEEDAERFAATAVAGARRSLPAGHWQTGAFLALHGKALTALKRFADAEAALTESLGILQRTLGADHARTGEVTRALAELRTAAASAEHPPPTSP